MTGTDAINSFSITKTDKNGKQVTMTITDDGNGIWDSNDSVKFTGEGSSSVFTSQDIKKAVTGYQIQSKPDGGPADVTKDASEKSVIAKNSVYRLGSFADSFFAVDKANATAPATSGTTTFTDPNAAYNASVAALGAKYQQITDTWKSTISNMGVCSLMTGDATQYYQTTQAYISVLFASLKVGGTTPAPAPTQAPAITPTAKATTAPSDEIFADDTKAPAAKETVAPAAKETVAPAAKETVAPAKKPPATKEVVKPQTGAIQPDTLKTLKALGLNPADYKNQDDALRAIMKYNAQKASQPAAEVLSNSPRAQKLKQIIGIQDSYINSQKKYYDELKKRQIDKQNLSLESKCFIQDYEEKQEFKTRVEGYLKDLTTMENQLNDYNKQIKEYEAKIVEAKGKKSATYDGSWQVAEENCRDYEQKINEAKKGIDEINKKLTMFDSLIHFNLDV